MKKLTLACAVSAALMFTAPVVAQDSGMDHSQMDHSEMEMNHSTMNHSKMDMPVKTETSGAGVINSVNAATKSINITHEPMPDLGWPTMTMDLPVTKKVDLSTVKAGDKVTFKLKLGRDKKYRVTAMEPAN